MSTIVACTSSGSDSSICINRLDSAINTYSSADLFRRQEIQRRFASDIVAFQTALADTMPVDSFMTVQSLSKGNAIFFPEVECRFPTLDSIGKVLGGMRDNFVKEFDGEKFPRCTSIISTYNQSIILVDTVMLIGMNHYLGEDHPAYASFEPYQRKVKNPRHISYDVALSIIGSRHPYADEKPTIVSRLLYEGACLYAVKQIIADFSLAEALGWTETQMEWANANEREIWNALISRDLLFSTEPSVADRLFMPSPSTAILHRDSPGQLGRFVGYRIVENYVKSNPTIPLTKMLSSGFYASPNTLNKAGYQP